MQKVAKDQNLDSAQLGNIMTVGFATALSSPVLGFDPVQTKQAAELFQGSLAANMERRAKLAQTLREFANS